jgi:hypothetical protein
MERGFVLDRNNLLLMLPGHNVPQWVEGEAESGSSGGFKTAGKRTSKIDRADRCSDCGYVEFFSSKDLQYG